jgi:hypothetical protein
MFPRLWSPSSADSRIGRLHDISTSKLTATQTPEKLVELGQSCGAFSQEEVDFKGHPMANDDLKACSKFHGIHRSLQSRFLVRTPFMSPAVIWDGLIVPETSNSWGEAEWKGFFEKKNTP